MNQLPEGNTLDLLKKAIMAFNERFSGLKRFELSTPTPPPQQAAKASYDAVVRLGAGKQTVLYQAELKPRLSHAIRHLLVMQKAASDRPLLLITHYVNPEMAERLIKDGLEFIDTAGNAFISSGSLHVISKGNPPHDRSPLPSPRLFKASGLKVAFALLTRPGLVTGTLRDIASKSCVSLGTASGLLEELRTRLYLIKDNRGARRLIRKKELLEAWVTAYPEHLRPKLHIGKYRGEHGWWHDKALDPAQAQWGGEIAASRLTAHLYPQDVMIYLRRAYLADFLLENRLRRDDEGNVHLLERFWPAIDQKQGEETVHPVLVYADLFSTGDERNIETAKIIYEQHISRYLRED